MNSQDIKFELIDRSFMIIDKDGWEEFSFKKLAYEKKIDVSKINQFFGSKKQLLKEFSKMIDLRVEKEFDFKSLEDSSTKDNLFELIMLRLDHLQPYKNSLKKIIVSISKSPSMLKSVSENVSDSLDFYLELTKAYDNSYFDLFKKKTILLIYSYIFKVWLDDNSEELSRTMSELDKVLSLSEKVANRIKNFALF